MDTAMRFPVIGTSLVAKPVELTVNVVALSGTERVNSPLTPVEVPRLVPFTITEAPNIGPPFSSLTVPVTVLFCADALKLKNKIVKRKASRCRFFFIRRIFKLRKAKFFYENKYKVHSYDQIENKYITNTTTFQS